MPPNSRPRAWAWIGLLAYVTFVLLLLLWLFGCQRPSTPAAQTTCEEAIGAALQTDACQAQVKADAEKMRQLLQPGVPYTGTQGKLQEYRW